MQLVVAGALIAGALLSIAIFSPRGIGFKVWPDLCGAECQYSCGAAALGSVIGQAVNSGL